MAAKIRIEMTPGSQGTRVWINDQEIHELVAVEVRAAVGDVSEVTFRFRPSAVQIEGEIGQAVEDVTKLGDTARTFRPYPEVSA